MTDIQNASAYIVQNGKAYKVVDTNSWNDLTDKPFYDAVTESINIEHDGDNTGKVIFTFSGMDFARMSDATVTNISDILEAHVVGMGGGISMEMPITPSMWVDATSDLGKTTFVAMFNNIPFIAILNEDINETHKKGIYVISMPEMYVTSFTCTIQRQAGKKLDPKYLPEGGVGYTKKETKVCIELDAFDGSGGYWSGFGKKAFHPTGGKTYFVTTESGTFSAVCKEFISEEADERELYIGDDSDSFSYFELWNIAGTNGLMTEAIDKNGGDTFIISEEAETIHKIDPKFLPDTPIVDLSTLFDYAESVLQGGNQCSVEYDCAEIVELFKKGPVKFKIKIGELIGEQTVSAALTDTNYGTMAQVDSTILTGG